MPLTYECVTTRAAEFGPEFNSFEQFISDQNPARSFVISPSTSVDVNALKEVEADYISEFPEVYGSMFADASYQSSPMVVTLFREAVLYLGNVLVVNIDQEHRSVLETIGESIGCSVSASNEFLNVKKELGAAASTKIEISSIQEINTIDGDYVVVMLSNVNNYAHWHVHNIAFIKWLCAHGQRILDGMNAEKFLVVFPHFGDGMGGEMKQHYFNMLKEQIPIDLHSPNPQDSPINLRNVLVSSTFNIDRGTNWAPYFKEVFESLRPEYDPSAPRLIYTNRGHARRRGAVNEEELEAALRLLGFSVLEPAKMSYGEQKRCFSNAELIVGGHGGALTNMVYSHRRPSVIELTHSYYGPVQYHWYRHLAAVIGGRHAPIVSKVPEPLQHKRLDEIYFE